MQIKCRYSVHEVVDLGIDLVRELVGHNVITVSRMCTANEIDTNVHMDPLHSPHYKKWHPKYKQHDVTQPERGDMYSVSPHLGPRPTLKLSSLLIITTAGSRARGLETIWHHYFKAAASAHASQ